jgi:hypothetical protein
MKNNRDLNKKIDETLLSLEGIQRAEASPFFFYKLQTSMQREEASLWEVVGNFITRPIVLACIFAAIVLMNFSSFNNEENTDNAVVDKTISFDYSSALATNFETEIVEP